MAKGEKGETLSRPNGVWAARSGFDAKGSMSGNFEDIWADLQGRLPVRERIQNWSADNGYLGSRFRIKNVEPSSITIEAGGMPAPHQITKSEFQNIFADWPAYRLGSVRRSVLRDESKNITFILSILHWHETSAE